MSYKSLDRSILRQLINPTLDMNMCEKVINALDSKTTSEKEKLLETLQKNMDNFKEGAKDFISEEVYNQVCNEIKEKIQQCGKYFQVTLSDILSLTEHTDISIKDIAWEYLSPKSIAEMIDEEVIGQHDYTKRLALATYLHLLNSFDVESDFPKMNLLVFGPSGVGKTFCAQVVANKLNTDFEIVNCNLLVQEGIVGENISDAITHAYIKNHQIHDLGILFDEFDKLFKDGYYNKTILQEFLGILDDNGEISFRTSFERNATYKKFPTRNIMVILGGVFDMLKPIVEKRMGQKFAEGTDFYQYVTKDDFSELFKCNELLGRIGHFVQVKNMTDKMLLDILQSETASPMNQYHKYFSIHNVDIQLTEDGAKEIVNFVKEQNLGVRGLKSVLANIFFDDMMSVKNNPPKTIVVNRGYVIHQLYLKPFFGEYL